MPTFTVDNPTMGEQILLGAQDNLSGLKNMVLHPIQTAVGIVEIIKHPIEHAQRAVSFVKREPIRAATSIALGWVEGLAFNLVTAPLTTAAGGEFIGAAGNSTVPLGAATLLESVQQVTIGAADMCSASGVCQLPSAAGTMGASASHLLYAFPTAAQKDDSEEKQAHLQISTKKPKI